MSEKLATLEVTQDELTAIGLVLCTWRAEHAGVTFRQALLLAMAIEEADLEVMLALIDRFTIRSSALEDFVFESVPEDQREELNEQRAILLSKIDQKFAEFAEQGRRLFPDADEDED